MAEIIKTFKEKIPAMRFIGKKYPNFGPMWGEWFANGWFDQLEATMGGVEKITAIWENGGGYVGLERRAEGQPFEDIPVSTREEALESRPHPEEPRFRLLAR